MRPILILLVVISASMAPAEAFTQVDNAASPRDLLEQAGQIEQADPRAAAEMIRRALPELQNTEDATLNREAQMRLCRITAGFDPATALSIAAQGLALARTANDARSESGLLLCKGDANKALGDTEAASMAYMSAIDLVDKAGNSELLSEADLRSLVDFNEMRARNLARLGNFEKAYQAFGHFRRVQRQLERYVLDDQSKKFDAELAVLKEKIVQLENDRLVEFRLGQKKQRDLWWQVVTLGSVLLALLVILALRQFYRKRRIRILAMTDELTRLPNRQHILTFLGDQARNAYEEEQPLSVIAFDIDNFKRINDKYGHEGGDQVIKAVADISNQALRRGDRVGRLGGKEFLVVLPGSPRKPAVDVAERLRRSIEVTELDNLRDALPVTISLGVCEWNAGHESIDALLKRTHGALDAAKRNGRNCVIEK